ncbi:cytochrome P450 [Laetiporus sulphureus 93-53]|uniref:Cytochrome P450 n=1 Tax=Laetiporus sulphureus 93-53 TaxID=1314785 RepID=A0A165CLN6_9APHY|nr:cytochrome P450 [Laetiporus sulphureus 93-53]KZT03032.1 cytochrome P450 [Laetiporus sulphureus 93-53]
MHPASSYRLRLLRDFIRLFVAPSLLLNLVLRLSGVQFGLLRILAYPIWITVCVHARTKYRDWAHARDAHRLGARTIPCVVGKWPGNLDIYLRLMKTGDETYLASVQLSLFEEYQATTLNLRLLWRDVIMTMDEKHIHFILATGFQHFWRGNLQKERMESFLGSGIFNRDDEAWKAHRALARPFFSRDRITDFELFERYTDRTLMLISSRCSADGPVEVQDLYARFTLDAASEFLFGQNLETLSGKLPIPGQTHLSAKGSVMDDDFGSFVRAFESAQERIMTRSRRGYFWPVYELFGRDPQLRHMEVIKGWVNPVFDHVMRNKAQMQKAGAKNSLDQSIFLEYLAEQTEDRKLIQDQLLNILLASRDTTSSLLTFITYFLAMHPDVAQKLRKEVLEYCGADGTPTFETIKSMRYMRAVINETLRVFPPVATNSRESRPQACLLPRPDCTLPADPRPLYFPASTPVIYLPILTHRNPALWGDDADKFDPDRWLDHRLSIFTSNPMIFTPFSAGPRICLGQNYALNEASYFLTRLIQKFDTFTLAPEAQPDGSVPPPEWKAAKGRQSIEKLWPSSALTSFVKGGLWVRFDKIE